MLNVVSGRTLTLLAAAGAVVFVNLLGFSDGHELDSTRIQIKKLEQSFIVYTGKHQGKFPDRLEDAAAYMPGDEVPTDAWGNPLLHVPPGTHRILSLGRDGKVGGEGLDADLSSEVGVE